MRVNDCVLQVILNSVWLGISVVDSEPCFLNKEVESDLNLGSNEEKSYESFFLRRQALIFMEDLLDEVERRFHTHVHFSKLKFACVFFIHYSLSKLKEMLFLF